MQIQLFAQQDLPKHCRQAWMSSSQLAPLARCPRGIMTLAGVVWVWVGLGLWNLCGRPGGETLHFEAHFGVALLKTTTKRGGGLIYCRWCDPLSAQYNEAYTALNHASSALTRRDISHICSGSVRCKRSFRTYTPKLCICFSLFSFPSCNLGKCRLITADIQFRTFKWTRKNSLEEVSISERVSLSEEVSISQSWT